MAPGLAVARSAGQPSSLYGIALSVRETWALSAALKLLHVGGLLAAYEGTPAPKE